MLIPWHNRTSLALAALISFPIIIALGVAGCGGNDDSSSHHADLESLGLSEPEGPFILWVNSYPEGATVSLNGETYGRTPLTVKAIRPGEYRMHLQLAPFRQIDTIISMVDGQQAKLAPFVFERRLILESNPPGAAIIMNGAETGKHTPFELDLPATDTINFSFLYAGFEPMWLSAVSPAADEANIPVGQYWEFETDSSSGTQRYIGSFTREVTIKTMPSGVAIILIRNDSLVGYSDAPIQLPCGERGYRLNKSGFNGINILPYITPKSQPVYVHELTRQIRIGAVDANGSPDADIGADILRAERGYFVSFLDAVTPATLTLVGAEQRLFLSAIGFEDTSVVIGADDTLQIVRMRKVSAGVRAHTDAAHKPSPGIGRVELFIRDRETNQKIEGAEIIAKIKSEDRMVLLGVTDSMGQFSQDLPPGDYEFRISVSDYKTEKKKHSVKAGDSKTLEILLKRE
ncbi:MAG: PEGA domain-containing protein [candidate division Zixibacteria bacterium]|nr:PEGA domain-containing protein [candidate division Zixibacteria bacterium]MBU1470388.1 PEGA domain-containing protein [candidate division Zixibacteria bacterium]MBU2624246.1 PEGA domain-containing protein [candidate division Zixibacteria bacterium]